MYIVEYTLLIKKPLPPETEEYAQLLHSYKQQGKLLDRIINVISNSEYHVTWIWGSRADQSEFITEPLVIQRINEIDDSREIINRSEEEI